ncbi:MULTISPECIES: MucB/RseB C-terminal domain-containing protein [unclassified Castellaniella]|uniref:MucB/RseB C-terminal domain-containing protein n=1 Tax=unclassified Castellaniella TaxID=2617606 RepID=UPI0033146189
MWAGGCFGRIAQLGEGLLIGLALVAGTQAAEPGPDLQSFLQQVQEAARSQDYSGVYVYQQGSILQSSRLVHLMDGTGEHERLETLDGSPRECLRQNGIEQCLHPGSKLVVSHPVRSEHFPGLLLNDADGISQHYEWLPSGKPYRIAGRDCKVSDIRARDALRYSYRICTDNKTHLLLRFQTLDAAGHLVDQVSFSSLKIGKDVDPHDISSNWDTRSWHLIAESSEPVSLESLGWRFVLPAGFQPVAELSRQIGLDHVVNQLVVSDGLAAISIFIETFDPKRDQNIQQGDLHQGAVNIYRMRLASYWLTAVGEAPADTVREFARNAQYLPQAAH